MVSSPRDKQQANGRPGLPALIEGTVPLSSLLRLRNKVFLEQLYSYRHLSACQIARMTDVSRSMVLEALDRFGIPQNGNGHKRPGHVPFGFNYLNYQLVKNKAEQAAIRMMRQYRAGGLSLRQIARELNRLPIPTKSNGVWQANIVRGVLARA